MSDTFVESVNYLVPMKRDIPIDWYKVEIDSNGTIYENLVEYIGNVYKEQGGRHFSVMDFVAKKDKEHRDDNDADMVRDMMETGQINININDADKSLDNDKKAENENRIPLNMPHVNNGEWIEIKYQDTTVLCSLIYVGNPLATMSVTLQHEVLLIACESFDVLQKLIFDAKDAQDKRDPECISIYTRHGSHWSFGTSLHKRKIDSVFIPNRDELMNDIRKFKASEKEYLEWGIPYKRNYFFYGPPGTGKTSIITAVASEFSLNVHICSFASDLDDSKFSKLISTIRKNSILVLEDIDSLFKKREKSMNSQVSFSCILNTLDGLQRKHGLMTFMTTNHKDELDEALTRPGRIDMSIKFDFATKEQIKSMFDNFLPKQKKIFSKFYHKIEMRKVSTAVLQKFLFERRECENILEHMDYFDNLCSQYGGCDKISESAAHMYS